jgi:hypothetical protein
MRNSVRLFTAIVVMVVLLTAIGLLWSANSELKRQNEDLNEQIERLTETRINSSELAYRLAMAENRVEAFALYFSGNVEGASDALSKSDSLTGEAYSRMISGFEARLADENRRYLRLVQLKEAIIDGLRNEARITSEIWEAGRSALMDSLLILSEELEVIHSILDSEIALREDERRLHGYLTFKSPKGKVVKYVGKVVNGKADGFGIGMWETGSVYEGYWSENKRSGLGTFRWADGEKYEGNYLDDQRSGWGVYHWKDGERYEGYWFDDRRNGRGTVLATDGTPKMQGDWLDDNLKMNELKVIPKGH